MIIMSENIDFTDNPCPEFGSYKEVYEIFNRIRAHLDQRVVEIVSYLIKDHFDQLFLFDKYCDEFPFITEPFNCDQERKFEKYVPQWHLDAADREDTIDPDEVTYFTERLGPYVAEHLLVQEIKHERDWLGWINSDDLTWAKASKNEKLEKCKTLFKYYKDLNTAIEEPRRGRNFDDWIVRAIHFIALHPAFSFEFEHKGVILPMIRSIL